MRQLEAGKLYAIGGGVFEAKYNEERAQFELWTCLGQSGNVVLRTGFEVGERGELYDRVWDYEQGKNFLVDQGYTLDALEEVGS